ncbi:glycosyltransferase family 2 protein [Limibacillus sp. MBR-115]|uniref:glycosyltransferase family 2 protein n=1 Tax=Limibacillus sp. MBR-115 TaxID=3156465 RepID=UPI003399DA2A
MSTPRSISIVIPFMDEEGSLEALIVAIKAALLDYDFNYEILLVDDGSRDRGPEIAKRLAEEEAQVRLIRFTRNFGKAAALMAGFKEASGEYIVTMDADLQDDPKEIPRLLDKLDEGYDIVSGWKKDRQDPIGKRLPSKVFNFVVARAFGLELHDMNCGLKIYRRDAAAHLRIYGELHRFTPAMLYALGFRVAELPVTHHPRLQGKSKYGTARLAKGLLDLVTVILLTRYRARPLHLFGLIGLPLGFIGFLILFYLTVLWFAGLGPIGDRPLLFFGILLILTGTQLLGTGLIAELVLASENNASERYLVADRVGFPSPDSSTPTKKAKGK